MGSYTTPDWPESRVESLVALAKDGYSAREIVDRLKLEGFKTTRNAVLGIANRRKIRVGVASKAGYLQSVRYGRKGKEPQDDMPPSAQMPEHGLCQWPLMDAWCGSVSTDGPYCQKHRSIAYTGEQALSERDIRFLSMLLN